MPKKTSNILTTAGIIILSTLVWESIERIADIFGFPFSLAIGPITIDVRVLSITMYCNPGTLIGACIAYILFKKKKTSRSRRPSTTRQATNASPSTKQ